MSSEYSLEIMQTEFVCEPDCQHCNRYLTENVALQNFYHEFSCEFIDQPIYQEYDKDYIIHVSKRVMDYAENIPSKYKKSVFVLAYYDFLLTNASFMLDHRDFSRDALFMFRNNLQEQQFLHAACYHDVDRAVWLDYLNRITKMAFAGWGSDFVCERDCEHCHRYLEISPNLETYLFGDDCDFSTSPTPKTDGDEFVKHVYERLIELSNSSENIHDKYILFLIACDFLLENSEFVLSNPAVSKEVADRIDEYIDKRNGFLSVTGTYIIDIFGWLGYFRDNSSDEFPMIKEHTQHEDMIYKCPFEAGTRYLKCSVKEDHVMNFNFMSRFKNTKDLKRITCAYCTNPVCENVYEQV